MKQVWWCWLAALAVSFAARAEPLQQIGEVPLRGVKGRIDHFGLDAGNRRLFVAALGNDTVEVIDLRANRRIRTLKGFAEPQGVQHVGKLNRLYVSNGKANRVDIFDAGSLERIKSVNGLEDADNIRYDAAAGRIYVAHGNGALRILDAATGEGAVDIRLAGHPESFQLEQTGRRIFANVPSARHVAVIDRGKGAVVATWALPGVAGNYPMALDEAGHRLFVGARNPATLVVYDTESGKVVAKLPIGGDTDDLFFDTATKRVYVICGEGVINVFAQENPDRYTLLTTLKTGTRARTGYFVPADRALYVAQPAAGDAPAQIRRYKAE
jgi:DNA-binding beta-propeller fold protein YncE